MGAQSLTDADFSHLRRIAAKGGGWHSMSVPRDVAMRLVIAGAIAFCEVGRSKLYQISPAGLATLSKAESR